MNDLSLDAHRRQLVMRLELNEEELAMVGRALQRYLDAGAYSPQDKARWDDLIALQRRVDEAHDRLFRARRGWPAF